MAKSKRVNLTVLRVAEFKATDSKQEFLWDSTVPGLGVRATRGGAKSYIFEKRFKGRTIRMKVGACSQKLSEIREDARGLQRLIDQGEDPRKKKDDDEAEERLKGMLISDVFDEYLKAHKGQWSERHMNDNLYLARKADGSKAAGPLQSLLQKRLKDVNAQTLIEWAKEVAETPSDNPANQGKLTSLQQSVRRFKAFWRWAYQREEYSSAMKDPSMFVHGDLKVLIPAAKPKNDVLEKTQLSAWFDAVRKIRNPVINAYLQILLLTGARRSELGELKWTDVDFQWKSLWIKDKVEEEGRKIPLTPYVEYLLSQLPRRKEKGKKLTEEQLNWVFYSTSSKSGRLVEPRIAHKRALSDAGLPSDLSLHGLRRSFASLAEWVEMPVGIVAQVMGHKPSATAEKHYKRRPLDLLALWHGKLEEWILTEGGVDFDAKAAREGLKVVK